MEYTSIVHGKKSQCCEPLVVEGWVPIAVFSLVVTGTRSTGVLTGESRAELAAAGNMGREALRRCSVLMGNFVLPNNMSKKTWRTAEKRVHAGRWSILGPADRILDVEWVMGNTGMKWG